MSFKLTAAAVVLAVASLAMPSAASAADTRHAAGFVCGTNPGTNDRLIQGEYRAAFHIRNGTRRARDIDLELALTFPPGAALTPGAVVSVGSLTLEPGEAVSIDCDELLFAADVPAPYISGVLEIVSQRRLDVTLIQSASPIGAEIATVSMTRIPASRFGFSN